MLCEANLLYIYSGNIVIKSIDTISQNLGNTCLSRKPLEIGLVRLHSIKSVNWKPNCVMDEDITCPKWVI